MPLSGEVGNKLLGWLMVGTGSLLAYSAYKNRAPWDVLRDIQGQPLSSGYAKSSSTSTDTSTDTTPSSFSSSVPRIRMIANREISPTLVAIKPWGRLDKDPAASLERIHATVGRIIQNVGNYRSYAEQAADYATDHERYAPPSKSLHVVGLAIDVADKDIADSVAAFTAEGWQRWSPDGEPWHWSYLVRG